MRGACAVNGGWVLARSFSEGADWPYSHRGYLAIECGDLDLTLHEARSDLGSHAVRAAVYTRGVLVQQLVGGAEFGHR